MGPNGLFRSLDHGFTKEYIDVDQQINLCKCGNEGVADALW